MQSLIKIAQINEKNFSDLAVLLNNDSFLLKSLGSEQSSRIKYSHELFDETLKWQKDNHADCYAIQLGNKSIGMISLSHQKDTHAKVGYWLASTKWNKGYTTQAFDQIIEIAKQRGFTNISASIDPTNTASKRIWENLGASFEISDDRLTASLNIL